MNATWIKQIDENSGCAVEAAFSCDRKAPFTVRRLDLAEPEGLVSSPRVVLCLSVLCLSIQSMTTSQGDKVKKNHMIKKNVPGLRLS